MVLDSSGLLCILFEEGEARVFAELLAASERNVLSSVSWLEAGIVIEARKGSASGRDYERFVSAAGIEIIGFDREQAGLALAAWRRYGKGRHPAALNLGDCCSYALSKRMQEPLLYKGTDFSKTDVDTVPY